MRRRIAFSSALVYCDGVEVFEGLDEIGGHYVAVALPPQNEVDYFALFGVSPRALQAFRLGKIDLRLLIVDRPEPLWWVGVWANEPGPAVILAESQASEVPEDYLPSPGFTLSTTPMEDDAWVRVESQARNQLAVEFRFESRIPSNQHRIGFPAQVKRFTRSILRRRLMA